MSVRPIAVLMALLGASPPAVADPAAQQVASHVSTVAAAYYCNCGAWPASWEALGQFDARVTATEKSAAAPFPWDGYRETLLSKTATGALDVDLAGPSIPRGTRITFQPPKCPAERKLAASCPLAAAKSDSEKQTIELAGKLGQGAGAYYCSCGGWPGSWQRLHEYDDAWHADWAAHGPAPEARFPWDRFEKSSLSTNEKDELLIQLVPSPLPGKHIGFKAPDCSTFDAKAGRRYCPSQR